MHFDLGFPILENSHEGIITEVHEDSEYMYYLF